jgi:DNA polymerase III epsilon subunit-like protein
MERFLRAVGEHGRVLVGHNVAFDRNVVAAEMYRCVFRSNQEHVSVRKRRWVAPALANVGLRLHRMQGIAACPCSRGAIVKEEVCPGTEGTSRIGDVS